MAWKTALNTYSSGQQATVWADFCAHIVSCGWTLHDAVSASKNVYYSQGESGSRTKEYIAVSYDATYVEVIPYVFWDNVAHVGYSRCHSYNNNNTRIYANSVGPKWFFGNENLVGMYTTDSSLYFMIVGHFGADADISTLVETTITSGVSASAVPVVIPVASADGFRANSPARMVDDATGMREPVTIVAVNEGVSVTVASLANDFLSGSRIGDSPSVFGIASAYAQTCIYFTCGTASGTGNSGTRPETRSAFSSYAPSNRNELYSLSPIIAVDEIDLGAETHLRAGTAARNSIFVVNDSRKITVLTATGGGAAAVDLSSAAWTVNEHAGKSVVLVGGTGTNQSRIILSNTATQLVMRDDWTTNPVSGTNFIIADRTYLFMYNNYWAVLENEEA